MRSLCQHGALGMGVWEAFQAETSIRSGSESPEPGGFNWGDLRNSVVKPLNY